MLTCLTCFIEYLNGFILGNMYRSIYDYITFNKRCLLKYLLNKAFLKPIHFKQFVYTFTSFFKYSLIL